MKRKEPDWEVLVVGAGIHGAGVFQAAAAAGYRTLLIEARGIAAGTSSRSSKLIHGGLRYLESFELGLVREALAERARLLRNAPELARLIPFHIPVYRSMSRSALEVRAGLSLYALLGGLGREARFHCVPRENWGELDGLRTDGLVRVFRYFDGQTDDAALTRAVVASGEALGGEFRCPARLAGARRVGDRFEVEWDEPGSEKERQGATTATLINAAGPWVERVRSLVTPRPPGFEIDLVGGTHVELPGRLARGAYYTEAPRDRRAVFHIPYGTRTLVGTTERLFDGDPAQIAPTEQEIDYLVETFLAHFPNREARVLDAWAGLRVLPRETKAAFRRSRETHLVPDERECPRTIAIYGGKLTTYRATADRVIALLARVLPPRPPLADTRLLRLAPP